MVEAILPDQFQEHSYTPVLRAMIRSIIECEAPIRDTILVERIARALGFQRSGRLIRDRVMAIVRQVAVLHTEEGGSVFVWAEGMIREQWTEARSPASEDDIRMLEDIALEELAAAMRHCLNSETEASRLFGIKRLTSASRERLLRAASQSS